MQNILFQIQKHKNGISSKYPYLNGLNNEQLSAVLQTEGPVLVFAGAGSGKTRVITFRALHIIKKNLANPNRILGVTFTNKAAGEMKERIKNALGTDKDGLPEFSTFHSFCLKVLRLHAHLIGYKESFNILDDGDSEKIIKEAITDLNIDIDFNRAKEKISEYKNNYIGSEEVLTDESGPLQKRYAEIYNVYNKKTKELNAMDFDDLLFNTALLFEKKPFVLEFFRDFYKYIMVDEFQDTNYIQDKLIKMLAAKHKNICVVGDDDQSIYGFRGALVDNILKFKNNFSGCKEIHLGKNYRSSETILSAASNVININTKRADKEITSVKKGGNPVQAFKFETDESESDFIAGEIKRLAKSGYAYRDIAVLYRINSLSRGIESSLVNNGIDYEICGGLKFYQRKEIKDIISFLKFAVNPDDFLSFKRSVSCVPTGAGEKAVEKIKRIADENKTDTLSAFKNGLLLDIKGLKTTEQALFDYERKADGSKLLNYFNLILKIKEAAGSVNAGEIIESIYRESGYEKILIEKSKSDPIQDNKIDNIKELIKAAAGFSNIQEFLDTSALDFEIESGNRDANKITLATIHGAKGLEFSVVFITGLEEGIFPHARSLEDGLSIEEERRLCYVGITRAKELLYMTCAENRRMDKGYKKNDVSRFVREIDLRNNN
ncbi:MAG: ATP-dependent helicase [bacterium]